MSTANKLTYLNGTKQAIKQAINEDFEVIDNNTTFREYADEISSNNAKYKDLIPKETKNATNTLDISNSAGLDKALVTQYGNTYQETTTGNQLLDFSKYDSKSSPTMTLTFENDVLTTTCIASGPYMNFTWIITDLIKANPGKTLSFTFDKYDVSQATDSSVNLQIYTGSNVSYFALVRPDGTSVPYTIPEDVSNISTVNFRILPNNLATPKASTLVITKPMLQFGTDKLDYEEYSGGKPSPNPDYPQEIQVVTGDNTVKIINKNLFDGLWTGGISNNFIKVYKNVNYKYSEQNQADSVNFRFYTNTTSEDYTQTYVNYSSYFTPSEDGYIKLYKTTTSGIQCQLEIGTTATTYVPYQSQTYPINLGNIELCKISTYKDRIYPLNGKWYLNKQIGKVVLDGSEDWSTHQFGTNSFQLIFPDVKSGGDYITILSSHFKGISYTNRNIGNNIIYNDAQSSISLIIRNTGFATLNDFKTWLSTHNTEVLYVLATPTTEEITESNYPTLYNQLNNIKLFEGVNHITMTNESGLDVEFDITYYKDWKLD